MPVTREYSRLAELPGVRSVSRSTSVPLDGEGGAIRSFAEGVATEFEVVVRAALGPGRATRRWELVASM
jgi:hypothetical protein